MRLPRMLIVGAGIGGLTLAAALDDDDVSVEIVERAERFDIVGAGIVLHPNGMSVLDNLGLAGQVVARGAAIHYLELVRGADVLRLELAQVWAGASQSSIAIHRADLHEILLGRTRARPSGRVHLHMGRTVVELEPGAQHVRVHFDNGSADTYDSIVAADGVNSNVRGTLFPGSRAQDLGTLYWRFCAPNVIGLPSGAWRTFEKPDLSFGFMPLGRERLHCFVQLLVRGELPFPPGAERAYLETTLAARDSILAQAVAARDRSLHVGLGLGVRPHHWRRGCCVLLGDAAHALSPMFSEGGSLAMEDALVLAHALRDAPHLDAALTRYEAARAPRVAWAARMATSQVNAQRRGRLRRQSDAAVATEHFRQMYQPLLRDPLLDLGPPPQALAT